MKASGIKLSPLAGCFTSLTNKDTMY